MLDKIKRQEADSEGQLEKIKLGKERRIEIEEKNQKNKNHNGVKGIRKLQVPHIFLTTYS